MKHIIIFSLLALTGCYIAPSKKSSTFELQAQTLNVALSGGGYIVGYPEIARMTLRLQFGDGSPLNADGQFLLESKKVRTTLKSIKKVGLSKRVAWKRDEVFSDSPRVAFAANPMDFTKLKNDLKTGCSRFQGKIWVSYPSTSRTTLIPGILEVEEGTFKELENRGKMKPYEAIYTLTSCDL